MSLILATDMARHNEYVVNLKTHAKGQGAPGLDPLLYMELLLKCADISDGLKPFDITKKWALRITDEFFLQVSASCLVSLTSFLCCSLPLSLFLFLSLSLSLTHTLSLTFSVSLTHTHMHEYTHVFKSGGYGEGVGHGCLMHV